MTGGQRPGRQVEFARDNRVVGAARSDRAVPPVKALRSITRPCSVSNRHSACGAVAANTASAERPHLSSPVGGPPCRRSPNGRPHARRSRLPEPCVSARMNATPPSAASTGHAATPFVQQPRRPGPRARAHPRLLSGSQLALRQSVGSWITCVGIRQLCAAQSEFSMEDAYRMTPSQAFVSDPPVDGSVTAAYKDDLASDGYINNSTRVWCWRPDVLASFQTLRAGLRDSSDLSGREVAAMVAATAAARGDPYCSLAWGARLAELSDEATAARVLQGDPSGLSSREAALARWSRQVVLDSNAPTQADVDHLRDVGLSDREIFEATAFIAFRLAFSTINNALGAQPDQELVERVPPLVREAVTYGRPRTE